MKKIKKVAALILSSTILFGSISLASAQQVNEVIPSGMPSSDTNIRVETLENSNFRLELDTTTGEIYLQNKTTGNILRSNPENAESDTVATGQDLGSLKSQVVVYYYDNESFIGMDSFSQCIDLGNEFVVNNSVDTLTVTYEMGEKSFSGDMLPAVISKKRMESDIFPSLTEDEKNTVLERYSLLEKENLSPEVLKSVEISFPIINKHDIYVKSSMPDYIAEEIYNLFKKAGYTIEDLEKDCNENEVENTYKETPFFNVTLEYSLNQDGFSVNIDPSKIEYSENYLPSRIEVLPLFGAADISANGYMLVPDGSGAVIELNNGKTTEDRYWNKLFGTDSALSISETTEKRQESLLPFFALSESKQSFWASIDSGYEASGVAASVAGMENSYNYIYSFFELFPSDSVSISSNQFDKFRFSSENILSTPISISYHVTDGSVTYSQIAAQYREYLIKNNILNNEIINDDTLINLELTATAKITKKFLGIPYTTDGVLTSYTDAVEIVEKLGTDKVDISFSSALKGGLKQKSTSNLKTIGSVGSKKQLKALEETVGDVYISYYAQSAASLKKADSAIMLSRDRAKLYTFDIVSRYYNKSDYTMLLSSAKLEKYAEKIASYIEKKNTSAINIKDLGYQLNSDFGENAQDRHNARVNVQKYLEKVSQNALISVEKGSIYSLAFTDKIMNIPVSSSGYRIEDYSVPFYQLVISGTVPYVAEPINLADDSKAAFLTAIETGAQLQYSWVYDIPNNIVNNSENYFGRLYSETLDEAKANIEAYSKYKESVNGAYMISHNRISETLASCEYSNGITVTVNYAETEQTVNGITVPAQDFVISEKGE